MRQVHYFFRSAFKDNEWIPYGAVGRQQAELVIMHRLLRRRRLYAEIWRPHLHFTERPRR